MEPHVDGETPIAFGVVLDNSGSMAGRPLECAKEAATMALKRTIRLAGVQNPTDVRVNEQVVEWVAEQEVGRTIAKAIVDRDRGDMLAVMRKLRDLKGRLEKYGRAENIKKALENLAEFEAASQDWTLRSRKLSRSFSTRSMKTSSYYAAQFNPEGETGGALPPEGESPKGGEPPEGPGRQL